MVFQSQKYPLTMRSFKDGCDDLLSLLNPILKSSTVTSKNLPVAQTIPFWLHIILKLHNDDHFVVIWKMDLFKQ